MEEFEWTTDNYERRHSRLAKLSMPRGAKQHKPAKAGRWIKKKPPTQSAVVFNMKGDCQGTFSECIELGLDIAAQEIKAGNLDRAKAVMDRIKNLRMEFDLQVQLSKLQQQLRKMGG